MSIVSETRLPVAFIKLYQKENANLKAKVAELEAENHHLKQTLNLYRDSPYLMPLPRKEQGE